MRHLPPISGGSRTLAAKQSILALTKSTRDNDTRPALQATQRRRQHGSGARRNLHVYVGGGDSATALALPKLVAHIGDRMLVVDPILGPGSDITNESTMSTLKQLIDGRDGECSVGTMVISLNCRTCSRRRGVASETGANAEQIRSKAEPWGLVDVWSPEGPLHEKWYNLLLKDNNAYLAGFELMGYALSRGVKIIAEHPVDLGDPDVGRGLFDEQYAGESAYASLRSFPEMRRLILEHGLVSRTVAHCAWQPGERQKYTTLIMSADIEGGDALEGPTFGCCNQGHTLRTGGDRQGGPSLSKPAAPFPAGMNWSLAQLCTGAATFEVERKRPPTEAEVARSWKHATDHLADVGALYQPVYSAGATRAPQRR